MSYKVVRFYKEEHVANQTLLTGLTQEQAQAHCKNPETDSATARSTAGVDRTRRLGPWFDGYEEE